MKKAKLFLCALLAMCLVLAFGACAGESDGGSTPPPADNTPAASADDPTDEPTDEPAVDPAPEDDFDDYEITVGPVTFMASQVLYMTDFSDGLGEWRPRCGGTDPDHEHYGDYEVTLELINDASSPTGGQIMRVAGRERNWNGATIDVTEQFHGSGVRFEALAWVKMADDASPGRVQMSYERHENELNNEGELVKRFEYWDDWDSSQGILSKYKLPMSAADDDPDTWDDNFDADEDYYDFENGWALIHGAAIFVPGDFQTIYFYIETTTGTAREQVIYIDSVYIFTP
jgi:hypothetical protein